MTKETIKVQVRLSRLLLTAPEDIITIADDIKMVPNFTTDEDGMVKQEYKVEVTNPRDYSKDEVRKIYNGNKMISRWVNTLDHQDGKCKLVIVID